MTSPFRTRRLVLAAALSAALAPAAFAQVLGPAPTAAPAVGTASGQPAQDWRSVLAELKIKPRGELERKRHHSEVEGRMADGREVEVTFDSQGRIWEIEVDDHDRPDLPRGQMPDSAAAIEAVRKAGFGNPLLLETKRKHTVVRAQTSKGEAVNLHVDAGGAIYKQVWVR